MIKNGNKGRSLILTAVIAGCILTTGAGEVWAEPSDKNLAGGCGCLDMRTAGEVAAGAIGSAAGLVVCGGGAMLLFFHTTDPENIGELLGETLVASLIAGIVGLGGSILGSATGVYIVGNMGDITGPFWSPLVGSALGTMLGSLAIAALKDSPDGLKFATFVLSQSIGATVLFNLTARRGNGYKYGALFNLDGEGFRAGLPMIHFASVATQSRLTYGANIEVLKCRF